MPDYEILTKQAKKKYQLPLCGQLEKYFANTVRIETSIQTREVIIAIVLRSDGKNRLFHAVR
jgi:hypothetical protein